MTTADPPPATGPRDPGATGPRDQRATTPRDERAAEPPDRRAADPPPATGPTHAADPPPAVVDHRVLNWRFVVPSLPDGLLLLAAAGEAGGVPGAVQCDQGLAALLAGPYPAVVVADLGRWAAATAVRGAGSARQGAAAKRLLARAAEAVAPGGWLYASFANPLYPMRPRGVPALSVAAAGAVVRQAGLVSLSWWLAFPDQQTPAYLVPAGGGAELEYFMRTFFFPYATGASARKARLKQRALTLMRGTALRAPGRLRPRFAPAFAMVAERPR